MNTSLIKKICIVLFSSMIFISCNSGPEYPKNADGSLTWLSIDQASTLKNNDEKLYFIDVYTEWCGWCKVMDKEAFTDPEVVKALEERFHVVKFNAEQTYLVNWEGNEYIYKAGGRKGIHELAIELLSNQLSYPSMVVLDKDRNFKTVLVGYKKPKELLTLINSIKG